MRLSLTVAVLASLCAAGAAFSPALVSRRTLVSSSSLLSTVESPPEVASTPSASSSALSGAEIKSRTEATIGKLREKDSKSPQLSKADIKVVFEDDHIIVVNKPSGVLCVPGKDSFPNLAQAVCDGFGCEMGRADKMVVHRLGMDTSGLVVFAKTMDAVRGMNAIFRARKIERKYEALVAGHVEKNEGIINLPLMRDYEFPPFMRISTDEHQAALVDLNAEEVGKKLLEMPKESLTKYEVVNREDMDGTPVSRVALTSISGRTHQLNVHLAAFGHPIVGDSVYGMGGIAAANGGLADGELESMVPNAARAAADVQQKAADAAANKGACVHAKSLKFRHPITKEEVSLSSDAPF